MLKLLGLAPFGNWPAIVRICVCFLLCFGCSKHPAPDPKAAPHHVGDRFRNNYPHPPIGAGFWTWQRQRWRDDPPSSASSSISLPLLKPDIAFLAANRSEPTLTWIGHATLLLQIGGVNVLTDPHLTDRASPLPFWGAKRLLPPALDFAELPRIDIVLISHNHYDHLDSATVRRLNAQTGGPPRFYVPLRSLPWFAAQGITNAVELDWWQVRREGELDIHFVPVQHWSNRTGLDRNKTLWGGWVIEHTDFRLLFCGDTGYSNDFRDIGERFGEFDLAAIPIGAYEPRWFMRPQHVDPAEAVKIHQDLRARFSVGIHWGTFVLSDEPADEPPRALARELAAANVPLARFFVMQHGETRLLAPLMRRSAADAGQ